MLSRNPTSLRRIGQRLLNRSFRLPHCLQLSLLLAPLLYADPSVARPPNILVVLVDDMSYNGLSCYGDQPWSTPHIDRLANEGMRFTDFYAYPVCSPTRAALLTGKSTARTGITNWIPGWTDTSVNPAFIETPTVDRLPLEEFTLAEALRALGYETALIGKWHLGSGYLHSANKQGFDLDYGIAEGNTKEPITRNTPFRGGKGTLQEGGIRVPLLARWPGRIQAGSTSDQPSIVDDLFPTLLELAGAKSTLSGEIDGQSLAPVLLGRMEQLPPRALFWHFPHYNRTAYGVPSSAMRRGNWKLIHRYEFGDPELYDLESDPGETNDLFLAQPQIAHSLWNELQAWRREMGIITLPPNPEYDPSLPSSWGDIVRPKVDPSY